MGRAAIVFQSLGIFYVIFVICASGSNGTSSSEANEERKVYIVYMGSLPENQEYSPSAHHLNILQQVVNSRFVEKSLVRSFTRSFNGFAAYLTDQEQKITAARHDVVRIFPRQIRQLHTTASWDFMKFHQDVHRNPRFESDVIIGVLDTGIWPESKSFNDHGLGPIPKNWKGACEGGKNFKCNKKIIGARNYILGDDENSARDMDGHGSHTASTAAGVSVKDASFLGVAKGTARGAVPSARIAVYKVCTVACPDDGIMAAFDDAIADGVDVLSLSLGLGFAIDIEEDIIAICSFHALKKGILTVQSAGNSGEYGSVASISPWLFTVAASSTSRKLVTKVVLGNGNTLNGNAINGFDLKEKQFPLINAKYASKKSCKESSAEWCEKGCLEKSLLKGKIVLCNSTDTFTVTDEAIRTGAIGAILVDAFLDVAFVAPFPFSPLTSQDFQKVVEYAKSAKKPTGTILKSFSVQDDTAPNVASFSSKGPNDIFPDILKPDITAPGIDILAAYSPVASPSGSSDIDHRSVEYNILSGTSMSCPHVTGAVAYVKSFHPNWSPSAIKSALMTTAWKMNTSHIENEAAEFGYGAGHINPTKATQPGLVYETSRKEYIKWICGSKINVILDPTISCEGVATIKSKDLNYPTMAVEVEAGESFKVEFLRTVKNVGPPDSIYNAIIGKNPKLNISVDPNILFFKSSNETKSFKVIVESDEKFENGSLASASIEWDDGFHRVRSPVVVYTRKG